MLLSKHLKLNFCFIWFFIAFYAFTGLAQNKDSTSSKSDSPRFPKDLVLIYQGNETKSDWSQKNFEPYVFRKKQNKVEWLFDGFLFLELDLTEQGQIYDFRVSPPAHKQHWEKLIEQTFAKQNGPDELEALMQSLAHQGVKPPYKRKVVLSVPNPIYGQDDWGTLDGKELNFYRVKDRQKAVKWYIDKLLAKWEEKNYQHLELSGLYWLRETIKHNSADVVQNISAYVHEKKNLDFYWMPFYKAKKAKNWRKSGFDIAYQQSNYYTDAESTRDLIMRRVDFGKKNGMAAHMEFDERITLDDGYLKKYYAYIDEFNKQNIWYNLPVIYDEGNGTWLKMAESDDVEIQEAHKKLSDLLVERKEKQIKLK